MLCIFIDSYIAENYLHSTLRHCVIVILNKVIKQLVYLAVRCRNSLRVHTAAVKTQQPCFVRDLQHIIFPRINVSAVYHFCSHCKLFHILLLVIIGLCRNYYRLARFQVGNRQLYHIGCLNIRKLLIHHHKLRDIYKL